MQENSNIPPKSEKNTTPGLPMTNPEEDGRNKEWQDRSRVNLEQVPEGTQTNIERDFEPGDDKEEDKEKKGGTPY